MWESNSNQVSDYKGHKGQGSYAVIADSPAPDMHKSGGEGWENMNAFHEGTSEKSLSALRRGQW